MSRSTRASGFREKPGLLPSVVVWQVLAALAISLAGLGLLLASVQAQDQTTPDVATPAFVPGEIIVGWHATGISAAAIATQTGASVVQAVDMRGLDGATGDAGVTAFLLAVPVGTELQAIDQLNDDPEVAFAEPNWIVHAAETYAEPPFSVDDPLYAPEQWYLQRIHASRGWQIGGDAVLSQAGEPIRVAVVDSGVDALHPDLRGIVLAGRNYITPSLPAYDGFGHGTHLAGLIGAAVNNDAGMAGTAPRVRLVPYKVLDDDFGVGPVSVVAQGIRDAADDGNSIINLSLELKQPSLVLETAVNYAAGKGRLLIGAAGNCYTGIEGDPVCPPPVKYPAAYNAVMAVAATGYANEHAYYSAVGNAVEIAAPGGVGLDGILSTWPAAICKQFDRVVNGGCYSEGTGTSMAAAIVSGVAAQVWSGRPDLTAAEVRALLRNSAARLSFSQGEVGAGLLDAQAAMLASLRSAVQVSPQQIDEEVAFGAAPFTRTVTLTNPSLEPISWAMTGTAGVNWLMLPDPVSGTVRYGEPAQVALTISPTYLFTGTSNTLWVMGTRANGSITNVPVNVRVTLRTLNLPVRAYMPVLNAPQTVAPGWPLIGFRWEQPSTEGRTEYAMVDSSSIGITIPFTLPFMGGSYADLRIFSDGYVALPASSSGVGPPVRCLSGLVHPDLAVFPWWGDLDPGAGGRVSTFVADGERFVIEFDSVTVKGTSMEPARVSFQAVLHPDGNIGINYLGTPSSGGAVPPVTVGLQAVDGRFYNQVVCSRDKVIYGQLPAANQSYLFTPEDLF